MNLYNLFRDLLVTPKPPEQPAPIGYEIHQEYHNYETGFIPLVVYVALTIILWLASRVRKPYLKLLATLALCILQASVLAWLALSPNRIVSLGAQCLVLATGLVCFIERLALAIRVHSMAPFVSTADNFAVLRTTCSRFVFPVESSKDNVVVLTTSRGVFCNGIHVEGPTALSDNASIVSLFSTTILLLDRVEQGYDYTVFVYISQQILRNSENNPQGVVNPEFDDVEL
nr:NS3 protein [Bat coronavirus GCCDC1]UMZ07438.1 NS3 protein [Bat coronavirus GCCDC1]UMZ07447.1 NS3 protein [Bat coronavirus GCCDC1]UMZ07499.1 NS3 protein [Bat coronavirus GCCDC1]